MGGEAAGRGLREDWRGGSGEQGERVDIHEKINPVFPSQAWRLKREIAGLMNLIRVAVSVNFRVNFRYY